MKNYKETQCYVCGSHLLLDEQAACYSCKEMIKQQENGRDGTHYIMFKLSHLTGRETWQSRTLNTKQECYDEALCILAQGKDWDDPVVRVTHNWR